MAARGGERENFSTFSWRLNPEEISSTKAEI